MKRLTFKTEHVGPVKDGTKRFTSRWRDQKLQVGDVVAAVTGKDGKPALLTPAAEGFATLRIQSVEKKPWGACTEEDAAKCGVSREWYLREKPGAQPTDPIFIYGFVEASKAGAA